MAVELVEDLRGQKGAVKTFAVKLVVFLLVLLAADRVLAWALKSGVDKYFGLDRSAEVLLVGNSHTVLGVDKVGLGSRLGMQVAKYARQGANLRDRLAMIRQYIHKHPDAVKTIVYDVDAHIFTTKGLSGNSYRLFYPFMDNPVVKAHILKAKPDWGEIFLRSALKTSRFSEVTLGLSVRGHLGKWTNLKSGTLNTARLKQDIKNGNFRRISFDPKARDLFDKTLEYVQDRGIALVLAYIPTVDLYNQAEPEKYEKSINLLKKAAAQYPNTYFVNYNPKLADRHDIFYDRFHMNPKGQKLVTSLLAEDILKLSNQRISQGTATTP